MWGKQRVFLSLFASLFIGGAEAFLYGRFFSKSASKRKLNRLKRSFSESSISRPPLVRTTSPLSGETKLLPQFKRVPSKRKPGPDLRKRAIARNMSMSELRTLQGKVG